VRLEDNAVIIQGPRVFDDDRVAVVYAPTSPPPTAETPPWTLLAGAIVLAAVVLAAGLVGYRRYGSGDGDGSSSPDAPGGPGPETGAGTRTAGENEGVREGGGDDEPGGGAGGEFEEDLSLLSDEERVERHLDRSGGRMRQADIVAETGWSDAKVSQLLSAMADEGRVEKLRLGRENLISLPDDASDDDASDAKGSDGPNGSEGSADGDGT
jgi:hypothetical protein